MALIVEDGSNVPNANTYVSRTDVIAYASARGVTLPSTDNTDILIIKAMDYLAVFDHQWVGEWQYEEQALGWPRKGRDNNGVPLIDGVIPRGITTALCQLVLHVEKGVDLTPTTTAQDAFIKREKVDVIETEYSEAVALVMLGQLPDMPLVKAQLDPYLDAGVTLRTRRV